MEQLTLAYPIDTAHPQHSVPMYFIHALEHPFCLLPGCWCQANKGTITLLLNALEAGVLTLSDATTFADDIAP